LISETLKYLQIFHAQVIQTAAFNAHHDLSQRLARSLLSAQDRSGAPELSLTQDLISIMLGVRRSTVSVAAATLQRAGSIRYQHGRITILDRVGLENAACDCYEAIAGEYRRLFGEHPKDIVRPHRFTRSGNQHGSRSAAGSWRRKHGECWAYHGSHVRSDRRICAPARSS
jgi:hypothetical protein